MPISPNYWGHVVLRHRKWWYRLDWAGSGYKPVKGSCSHLHTLLPRSRIFLPWRWRLSVLPKRRFTQDLHVPHPRKRHSSTITIFILRKFIIHNNPVSRRNVNCRVEMSKQETKNKWFYFSLHTEDSWRHKGIISSRLFIPWTLLSK
jgi:hypothetical protein